VPSASHHGCASRSYRQLFRTHVTRTVALTSGFHYALVACSIFLVAASVIASRASNSRAQTANAQPQSEAAVVTDATLRRQAIETAGQ
jgi:hypothetical protein